MPKRIDQFVSENRKGVNRLDSSFITVSGQSSRNLSFNNNTFEINTAIRIYTRPLNNGLVSGHPDGQTHGSGHGVSGDQRGGWTLVESSTDSEQFVSEGRNAVASALGGDDTAHIAKIGVGSDDTGATPNDTSLKSSNGQTFAWPETGGQSNQSVATGDFRFHEYGETIRECAVFTTNGDMYNRLTLPSVSPTNDEEIRVEVEFTIQGNSGGAGVITDTGEDKVAQTFRTLDTVTGVNTIAFGSGSGSPDETDTSLSNQEFEKNVARNVGPESLTTEIVVFQSEPSSQPVDLTEMGAFAPDGSLLWLTTFESFEKNENVEFQASLRFRVK